jgi:hypothetical protein
MRWLKWFSSLTREAKGEDCARWAFGINESIGPFVGARLIAVLERSRSADCHMHSE